MMHYVQELFGFQEDWKALGKILRTLALIAGGGTQYHALFVHAHCQLNHLPGARSRIGLQSGHGCRGRLDLFQLPVRQRRGQLFQYPKQDIQRATSWATLD